jgi:hypothetical protein
MDIWSFLNDTAENTIADDTVSESYDDNMEFLDTDGNGLVDSVLSTVDNGDGTFSETLQLLDEDTGDVIAISNNFYDSEGNLTANDLYTDENVDGNMDTIISTYLNENGEVVTQFTVDENDDGVFDASASTYETYVTDDMGDERLATVTLYDSNGDFVAETVEYSTEDGSFSDIEYFPLDDGTFFEPYDNNQNFDANNYDPSSVIGDPAASMEYWENQPYSGPCSLYAQSFAIEELLGRDIDMGEFLDIAEANGWCDEDGSTPVYMCGYMLEYYGCEVDTSVNADISDIEECLKNGGKAVVAIDADEIWYNQYGESEEFLPDGVNHAVEVIGIDYSDPDNPMVILNDSGTTDGRGSMYPLDLFVDAWEDSSCYMVAAYAPEGV